MTEASHDGDGGRNLRLRLWLVIGLAVAGFCTSTVCSQTAPPWITHIESVPLKARPALADSLCRAVPNNPLLENDSVACLLYMGYGTKVAVAGDVNGWSNAATPMKSVQGTALWYVPLRLPPDARVEYKLVLEDSVWIQDPRSQYTAPGPWGDNSELRMPDYRPPARLERDPAVPGGSILDTVLTGPALTTSRRIKVYIPPGYSVGPEPYALLVVHDGLDYLSRGRMAELLDNLIHERVIPPMIALFVPPVDRTEEYSGALADSFSVFVTRDLLGWVDRRFRTDLRPSRRAVLGASNGGNIALYQGIRHPRAFGMVAAQSSNVTPEVMDEYARKDTLPGKVYLDLGLFDVPVVVSRVRGFRDLLESRNSTFLLRETHEGHNWTSWRSRLPELLRFLFAGS